MRIAVFEPRLLPEMREKIQTLTSDKIVFWDKPCSSEMEFIQRTGDAEIILVAPRDKVTASYLQACPSVKYVGVCGTTTAHLDIDELRKRGIAWSNATDYGDEPTAEFAFMQLTRLLRGVGRYQWKDVQHELMGKKIGIVGLGALGKAVAHLALAYRMDVLYYSTHRKPEWESRGLHYREMPELAASSDIVTISSPTNLQVFGEYEFGLLKPGSILLQLSVGNVLDRNAFLKWVTREGNYAIFDKSAGEDNYRAYKNLPRVIFAQAVAGDTYETLERLGQKVYDNVKTYLAGNPPN